MSKILRAIDELWLPPHLRREPSVPPTGRRFLNRRCCCPATLRDCEVCEGGVPNEIEINLTTLGLSDDECDFCDQITGTFILEQDTVSDNILCNWGYCLPAVCVVAPSVTQDFRIWLRLEGTLSLLWRLQIDLGTGIGCGIVGDPIPYGIHLEYVSDSWLPVFTPSCMYLEDENGDIEVTYQSGLSTIPGCT